MGTGKYISISIGYTRDKVDVLRRIITSCSADSTEADVVSSGSLPEAVSETETAMEDGRAGVDSSTASVVTSGTD